MLGRVVWEQVRAPAQAGDRGSHDDRPAALLAPVLPKRRSEAEEDAAGVDRHNTVELIDAHVHDRPEAAGDARIQVMQVDAAEPLGRRIDAALHVLLGGHVGAHGDGLTRQLGRHPLGALAVDVDHHQHRPVGRQPPRGRVTQAPGRAGHQHDPAGKPGRVASGPLSHRSVGRPRPARGPAAGTGAAAVP